MDIGKVLMIIGFITFLLGMIFFVFKGNIPRLPGDILIQRDNFSFYFPIATSILVSIILTIVIKILNR